VLVEEVEKGVALLGVSPLIRFVKPGLTNRFRRPVSGCVRTTGCSVGVSSVKVTPSHSPLADRFEE
jgi:hypothetical protein